MICQNKNQQKRNNSPSDSPKKTFFGLRSNQKNTTRGFGQLFGGALLRLHSIELLAAILSKKFTARPIFLGEWCLCLGKKASGDFGGAKLGSKFGGSFLGSSSTREAGEKHIYMSTGAGNSNIFLAQNLGGFMIQFDEIIYFFRWVEKP